MRTIYISLAYLIGIACAELITATISPLGGIIFHLMLLFLLILGSAFARGSPARRLYLALTLAPLMRILCLSMPLAQFSEIYWYLIISIPLIGGILAVIRALNLNPGEIGITARMIPIQGLVAVSGISLGLLAYFIMRPEPLVPLLDWREILVPALILLVVTGFIQELAFRGVMQHCSDRALGSWGWVYIAVLFSVLQIGYLSAIYWLFALLVGLFFGWTVKRTGSILGVSLSHGIINIGLYLIFPFIA